MTPTAPQLACLRLATQDALRYYKGGWYSNPPAAGSLRAQRALNGRFTGESTTPQTINACMLRGWLTVNETHDIYARRWTITEAGRRVIAEMEAVNEPSQ